QAGIANTTGTNNAVFGRFAGGTNTTGSSLSLFGEEANSADGLMNATAIGSRAFVSQSNALVLGGISRVHAGTDTNVGIGTTAPSERLHVVGNALVSGTMSANMINATTQYNLNGLRAFTVNGAFNDGTLIFTASNTFAGDGAGLNTTPS